MQRGGRASEKNQNHKPDVTAPVCTDRKFLLLRGVSARITHHARDTPATFTVFSQLNARLPTVRAPLSSAFFFCFVFCFHFYTNRVFRNHSEGILSSFLPKLRAYHTNSRGRVFSFLQQYFRLQWVVMSSKATPTPLANMKPLKP